MQRQTPRQLRTRAALLRFADAQMDVIELARRDTISSIFRSNDREAKTWRRACVEAWELSKRTPTQRAN